MGPVSATFRGNVALSDLDPPNGDTLTGQGQGGAAGFARMSAQVSLTAEVNVNVEPTMRAEDIAFMLQQKSGCYVFIGNGEGGHRDAGHGLGPCNLHNPSYDFNDALLPIGATGWWERSYSARDPAEAAD